MIYDFYEIIFWVPFEFDPFCDEQSDEQFQKTKQIKTYWISEWECNSKPNPKKPGICRAFFYLNISNSFPLNFFETSKQAELFSIFPSEIILKLFSFSVEPVEVISVINSAEPVKG